MATLSVQTAHLLWTSWGVVNTLAGILFLWATLLIIGPIAVSMIDVATGIQRFPGLVLPATIAMPIFALLGLWAALTLAIERGRSRRPADEAEPLVVTGPYAHVRNPLVISALGQGTAIALALGSLLVSLYVVIGAVVWHAFLRPREEQRLRDRHGAEWDHYMREVRALRPRLRPYGNEERRTKNETGIAQRQRARVRPRWFLLFVLSSSFFVLSSYSMSTS